MTVKKINNSSLNYLRGVMLLLMFVLFGSLTWAVVALPEFADGQRPAIMAHLAQSGVSHPVTAVLLNFRAYDTLLEIGVLLLVLLGAWSFGPAPNRQRISAPDNPLLTAATQFLVPVFVVIAGYLLWVGAHGPGGAFHAGAILGAAGVLLTLVDRLPVLRREQFVRLGMSLGLLVFIFIAIGVIPVTGNLLQYPSNWSKELILLIEGAAALSIGLILTGLYLGGQPTFAHTDPQGGNPP